MSIIKVEARRRVRKITKKSLGVPVKGGTALDDYRTVNDLFPKMAARVDFLWEISAEFGIDTGGFDTQLSLQGLIQHVVKELKR